ncbi:hypothetical protein GF389_03980 [Candidatus Dojkabacteria bacterium]|nr:hypothetical protein [Candidatus Dojkabacteria bacterium]
MTSAEFFDFLKKYRDLKTLPNSVAWPDRIGLSDDIWKGIVKLNKWTNKHGLEYETSCYFADGDVVFTPPLQGERSSVTSTHSMNVKYVPKDPDGSVYEKQIYLDGKLAKRVNVKRKNLPQQGQIKVGFLFNIHSHPIHYLDSRTGKMYDPESDPEYQRQKGGFWKNFVKVLTGRYKDPRRENPNLTRTYSFFSDVDIASLLSSGAILSGLVTKEFWLVGKTDKAVAKLGPAEISVLMELSRKSYAGDKFLDNAIKSQMANLGLVFYRGRFHSTLERIL